MSCNPISSAIGTPFCSISTSPRWRISQSIARTCGIKSLQDEVPLALSSSALKALAHSDGQMVFGYERVERRWLR